MSHTTAGTNPDALNADVLLTIPEACTYLGTSETFVRREIRSGALTGTRLGRLMRVRRSALEAYLASAATSQL